MVKLVLFDIDGTLIHSGGAGVRAFALAFAEEFGIPDGTQRLRFCGRTDISLVREFFVMNGIEASQHNFERFFRAYLALLETHIRDCEGGVCPGIVDFMAELETMEQAPLIGLLTGNARIHAPTGEELFRADKAFRSVRRTGLASTPIDNSL